MKEHRLSQRRTNVFLTVPNDTNALATIKQMRHMANLVGCRISARGRCKNRKQVFASTGRYYSKYNANVNDISLRSKEAPFCHSWALYIYKKSA